MAGGTYSGCIFKTMSEYETMCERNGMIYTIAAIQKLSLRFSVDSVSVHSAKLLVNATQILQGALSARIQGYETLFEIIGETSAVPLHDMLCTWRPAFCIDIFLYFGKNDTVIVGLPMLADDLEPNSKNDDGSAIEIKHFSPENTTAVSNLAECVCFAHLTCDTDEEGNNTMVALVYDILLQDENSLDTRQRYEFLRSISDPLSRVVIGDACVRVQWAGDPCMYDRLKSLVLPHAHNGIVLYGNDRSYSRFAFELEASVCASAAQC